MSRLLRSASLLMWVAVRTATAQSQDATFGEVRRISLPGVIDRPQFLSPWRNGSAVLLAPSRVDGICYRLSVDSSWHTGHPTRHFLPRVFDEAVIVEPETDGRCTIAFADRRGRQIHLVTSLSGDTLRIERTIPLPVEPSTMLVADLNNDRRNDLIVIDRNTPGMLPLIAEGHGRFTTRRLLAPDNFIGAAAVMSLNNDDLADIVLYDWVKSELHLWYGIGEGRFVDQSVFPVAGEVETIAAGRFRRNTPPALVLNLKSPRGLQYWTGTEFGDFLPTRTLAVETTPSAVAIGDINRDGWKDIVLAAADGAFSVRLNDDSSSFQEQQHFACPAGASSLLLTAPSGDDRMDAVIGAAGTSDIWVMRNAGRFEPREDPVELICARRPSGIVAADLNRDGTSDAMVVHRGDSVMTLYWGRPGKGLSAPESHVLGFPSNSITVHSVSDSMANVLVASLEDRTVAFVSFVLREDAFTASVIPTDGVPWVLTPFPAGSGAAGFAVLNGLASDERYSLSFFEQVGPERFLEQSFRLAKPNILLGATVADVNGDGFADIVYAYQPADTANIEIAAAFGDSTRSMKRRVILQELPRQETRRIRLWTMDLDTDDTLDILVQCAAPASEFWTLRGKKGGAFDPPVRVAANIDVRSASDVQIADVDDDGIDEVVVLNRDEKRLLWFHAAPNADHRSHTFVSGLSASAFALGDFDHDGSLDVAMLLQSPDVVRVYSGTGKWLEPERTAEQRP